MFFKYPRLILKKKPNSLTDQIRRSSRSVCANITEAYRKRKDEKHFVSKLTDSDADPDSYRDRNPSLASIRKSKWLYFPGN